MFKILGRKKTGTENSPETQTSRTNLNYRKKLEKLRLKYENIRAILCWKKKQFFSCLSGAWAVNWPKVSTLRTSVLPKKSYRKLFMKRIFFVECFFEREKSKLYFRQKWMVHTTVVVVAVVQIYCLRELAVVQPFPGSQARLRVSFQLGRLFSYFRPVKYGRCWDRARSTGVWHISSGKGRFAHPLSRNCRSIGTRCPASVWSGGTHAPSLGLVRRTLPCCPFLYRVSGRTIRSNR